MNTEGKVAIVTGGANGIGKAIALRLAAEGASVVVADIDTKNADKVVGEIKALGREALVLKVDVTRSRDTSDMAGATLDRFGRIDILINNAGGAAPEKRKGVPFHQSEEALWDFVIDLNLKGVLNCCKAVVGHMMDRKGGKIVNIASTSGMVGSPTRKADYAAAKAGVINFTQTLAREVGPYGINVNCVSPGPIETRIASLISSQAKENLKRRVWLGRWGQPEEVASLAVFLASDEASFITGQNFGVNGGMDLGW